MLGNRGQKPGRPEFWGGRGQHKILQHQNSNLANGGGETERPRENGMMTKGKKNLQTK